LLNRNPRNNLGTTPLHHAAWIGYLEIFVLTLPKVQDKNPGNDIGMTTLYFASANGYIEMCEWTFC
jgi:ankyrin repeat protein